MTGWAETSWSERADRSPPAAQAALLTLLGAAVAAVLPNGWVEALAGEAGGVRLVPVDLWDRVFLSVLAGLTVAAVYALVRWLGERRPARPAEDAAADHPLRVEPLAATRDLGPRFDDSPYLAPPPPTPPPTPDARLDPDSTLADPRWRVPDARPSEPEGWAAARSGHGAWLDEEVDGDMDGDAIRHADLDTPGHGGWTEEGEPSRLSMSGEDGDGPGADGEEWDRWVRDHEPVEAKWVDEPAHVTPVAAEAERDATQPSVDAPPPADPAAPPPPPPTPSPFGRPRPAGEPWDGRERRRADIGLDWASRDSWPAGDRRHPPSAEPGREDPALPTTAELLDRLTRAAERVPTPDPAADQAPRESPAAPAAGPAAELQAAIEALRRAG